MGPLLSTVMSRLRGDISLVIRIATIIEIFGHVFDISWAYFGHNKWQSVVGVGVGQWRSGCHGGISARKHFRATSGPPRGAS